MYNTFILSYQVTGDPLVTEMHFFVLARFQINNVSQLLFNLFILVDCVQQLDNNVCFTFTDLPIF